MKRVHQAYMRTDENGKAAIDNPALLAEFFKLNPNQEFIATFKKRGKDHTPATVRYFFAEVVPKLQAGFKSVGYDFDKETTADYVKQFCPVMYDEVIFNGEVTKRYKSITELDQDEFGEYIDALKRFAAEEFSILINDPIK